MEFKYLTLPSKIKKIIDEDSKKMKIVTRFPPEPSGYFHIGHAKALYINMCIAKHYNGKIIFRMDNTNPLVESDEYEKSIIEDISFLVGYNIEVTHTSDYFGIIYDYAIELIKKNWLMLFEQTLKQ